MGFRGYGLSLSEKTKLVKSVGYYPQILSITGPGQEFPSVLDPYIYLFKYYYQDVTPNTAENIDEYSVLKYPH